MCGCSWDGQLGSGSRGYCLYPSLVTHFSDPDHPQHQHARAPPADDAIVQEEEEEEEEYAAALEDEGGGGGSRSVRAPPPAATLRPRFSWQRRRGGGVRCDMDSKMAFNMSSACIMEATSLLGCLTLTLPLS
jgi:hypothetical protein